MKTAIITAIYNDYDTLKPILNQNIDVEWICVTDTPHDYDITNTNGWEIVYEPRPHLHPNRAAKTPKCLPWLYTDAPSSIWIDASYQVTSPNFAEDVLSYAYPIAQFNHPWRQCAYDEAEESLKLDKYITEWYLIDEQRWDLRNVKGHPHEWGLWATGVIARHHEPRTIQAGADWLSEIYQYSYQDQISHPDVMRRNGLRPINLPGTHLANEWLAYRGSGRH